MEVFFVEKMWEAFAVIVKVIVLYVGYLLNQWMGFLPAYIDVLLGQA